MGHIEVSREINADADAVWKVIANPQTYGDWFTVHAGWIEEAPANVSEGAKLAEKIVMLGMANKIEWNVEKVEQGRSVTLAGTGMAGVQVRVSFTVEPAASGAKFGIVGDFEGALIKGALGKAVEKDFDVQLETSLKQLEELASA